MRSWPIAVLALWAGAVAGQEAPRPGDASAALKLRVEGHVLHYDTVAVPEALQDISGADVDLFRRALRDNPQVTLVQLNSYGGEVEAARDMADLVRERQLDTRVEGTCDSACPILFLAGRNRSLAPEGRIGFHRFTWDVDSIRDFYDQNARDLDWGDPHELSSWLYEDTQAEVYEHLAYMLSRGVDPVFAIQTLRQDSTGMWYPPRALLMAAGVLTRLAPGSEDGKDRE
ncbi:MAG: hypothetical protein EP307_10970 [Rhodobacteraceae bacterium]|nr:MAG: hypothetical protein EP307_10970 [Paracoccaceae bacterium]